MAGASAEETDLLRRSKKKTKRGLSERDNDPMQMEGEDTVDPLSNGNNPANEQSGIPSNTVKRPTDPTFEFNFGTNGGASGALPFTSGVPGAHPSTSGSSSMASGYNTVSQWVASTSGASNSAGGMAARTSRGRQRIEMVKIQKKSSLEVTFSKRRTGLFKKASVLSTLCGADVAIIVFSPAGNKVFSFGHPTVEAVVERFLGEDNPTPVNETGGRALATEQFIEAQRNARVQELNMELTRLEAVFELEKKRGEAIDGFVEANRDAHGWMRGSYDELSFQQLVTLKIGMENLMKEIQQRAHHQLMAMHENGTSFNSYAGGVFPSGNMVPRDTTSEFNFGTNGGPPGALPFSSGVPGAHPSTSGSSSMAGGYNTVSPWVASTSGASNSAGGNLGASHAFY
nr:agamous-like MADS-box protein AGL62 [Ipomoea batatas]